jgi:hypothetical protein
MFNSSQMCFPFIPVFYYFRLKGKCPTHLEFVSIRLGNTHVKWVHCHDGMEHPRDADIEDEMLIWRVAIFGSESFVFSPVVHECKG